MKSRFGEEEPLTFGDINFTDAVKLPAEGSLCDAYIVEMDHRRLFVKRLKEEFRGKPYYRAALTKEYEIGSSLRHKALPTYRGMGEDYIVMDYVEGKTLDRMMRDKDEWLTQRRNIDRLLVTLLDVAGYLHQHNIVHCDIKADNVIITGNTGNAVLIDLDKCYSDSLCHTAGDPAVYGLGHNDCGNPDLDFRGIGMIVEEWKKNFPQVATRRYRQFERLCYKPKVDPEDLYTVLTRKDTRWLYFVGVSIFIVGLIAVALLIINSNAVEGTEASGIDTALTTVVADHGAVKSAGENSEKQGLSLPESDGIKPFPDKIAKAEEVTSLKEGQKRKGEIGDALEQTIQNCYSHLIPTFGLCDYFLNHPSSFGDDKKIKEKSQELVVQLDKQLAEGRKGALQKIAAQYPQYTEKECEDVLRKSAYYQLCTSMASRYRASLTAL